ncbi:hypothetical protein C772_03201 [Bhargavaea cecembensis DSE10]|uniref:Uncharacterized protein n=1 Tax=Bhargavaea cecembensis DSE10 TaxID=1235279 RepID=M7NCI4_9BACL|nr:hypothetical protein [Bhargavaea cecembensis]EMR04881.1 hypothetical protein C772_03201 [Bhargavaea cecembensis DSE10]
MNQRRLIEELWGREKYRVMYHSRAHDDRIRKTLKADPSPADIETRSGKRSGSRPTPVRQNFCFWSAS